VEGWCQVTYDGKRRTAMLSRWWAMANEYASNIMYVSPIVIGGLSKQNTPPLRCTQDIGIFFRRDDFHVG
jgi:acyl-coenzyme A synthetase/AMP-(fatty) acid ligase